MIGAVIKKGREHRGFSGRSRAWTKCRHDWQCKNTTCHNYHGIGSNKTGRGHQRFSGRGGTGVNSWQSFSLLCMLRSGELCTRLPLGLLILIPAIPALITLYGSFFDYRFSITLSTILWSFFDYHMRGKKRIPTYVSYIGTISDT